MLNTCLKKVISGESNSRNRIPENKKLIYLPNGSLMVQILYWLIWGVLFLIIILSPKFCQQLLEKKNCTFLGEFFFFLVFDNWYPVDLWSTSPSRETKEPIKGVASPSVTSFFS